MRYQISGDVFSTGKWTDYCRIGLSNDEIYISGNLFGGGFDQAFIMGIPKSDAYNSAPITPQSIGNIQRANSQKASTLLPLNYGQLGNYGPGLFFVSTYPGGGSEYTLLELTDDISSGNQSLIAYDIPCMNYINADTVWMEDSIEFFRPWDCRALDGFLLDNTIHFVTHVKPQTGKASAVAYFRCSLPGRTNTDTIYQDANYSLAYPSIASFSVDSASLDVLIGYLLAGLTEKPGMGAITVDSLFQFSTELRVKSGTQVVLMGSPQRWGDYTGMARKHDETHPTCWFFGHYGDSTNYDLEWNTFIAEISDMPMGISSSPVENSSILVYPNPSSGDFFIDHKQSGSQLEISLLNLTGSEVYPMQTIQQNNSPNQTFVKFMNVIPGIYFLKI